MSYTTAAKLSRGQFAVAIFGATGNLGSIISQTFLSPGFRPFFSRVLVFTRDPTSDKSRELESLGAEIVRDADADLKIHLKGVDVVVDALGSKAGPLKTKVMQAAILSGVKVYFPSEYGVDHRLNDFGDWDNKEWVFKREHVNEARKLAEGRTKVIAVYVGLFLETGIAPFTGFDTPAGLYTSIGSPTVPSTFTSKVDIARSLAELSLLAVSPSESIRDSVPDDVRIAGTTVSVAQVAEEMQKVTGKEIKVDSVDLGEFRKEVKDRYLNGTRTDPVGHIRILMAEGKLDFSKANSNELVNPGETGWTWTSLTQYAQKLGGRS